MCSEAWKENIQPSLALGYIFTRTYSVLFKEVSPFYQEAESFAPGCPDSIETRLPCCSTARGLMRNNFQDWVFPVFSASLWTPGSAALRIRLPSHTFLEKLAKPRVLEF